MTIADIKHHVEAHLGVENDTSRATRLKLTSIAIYIMRKHTNASYPEIAKAMGYARHSTAAYHDQNVRNALRKDASLRGIISEIERDIRALMNPDYAAIITIAESGSITKFSLMREQLDAVQSLIASFAAKEAA